mgnify:CR=1 FL=1
MKLLDGWIVVCRHCMRVVSHADLGTLTLALVLEHLGPLAYACAHAFRYANNNIDSPWKKDQDICVTPWLAADDGDM